MGLIPLVAGLFIVFGAARDRPPRWRRIPAGVGAVMAVAAVAIVTTYRLLGDAPEVERCRELRDAAKSGVSPPADARATGRDLRDCGLDGGSMSPAERDVLNHR